MAINAGQIIVKGGQPVEEQKPQPSLPKNEKKKKINILTQRNRTQIFNFDKSSAYMEDLLTSED